MVKTAVLDKRAVLADHFLFGQLEPAELERILGLGVEKRFSSGQVIFQKGEEGNSMMVVLRGQVRISLFSEEGKELILTIIPTGGCFGEMALLDGKERSADATAIGECVLFIIARRDFIPFLEHHPRVAIRLLALVSERLRYANELVENIAFLNLPARLARLLLKLALTHGENTQEGVRIGLKISQQDLGNLIATSRESVNKQLRQWQEEGLLAVRQGYLTILQPEALKDLAECSF